MNPVVLTSQQFEFITSRLSQFYINNENANSFLQSCQFKIPLQEYLCVCYGVENSTYNRTRKIEFFRFIGFIEGQHGYWIQCYTLPDEDKLQPDQDVLLTPSEIFSIHDCNHLRQAIFEFQDKTSLFRSTLFFVPNINKLFRMHCVLQFLTLPTYSRCSYYKPIQLEKFLISESKKKQILKRLRSQITLWEESIEAHGALERTLSEPSHKK